jgi:multisubunit Na+/H+ antiporter MnhG subunit
VREALATALLAAAVALQLLGCIGVLAMREPLARLHYVGVSALAALCLAGAVLVRESFSLIADKALLLAAFLLVTSPVLAHYTARTLWERR